MTQTTHSRQGAGSNRPGDGAMYRPHDDRVVAGVALAVANRLGMSPGAVRVIWFVLIFFGGLGLLLYLAGWLLIPEEGAPQSVAEETMGRLSDSTAWLGVALIVAAVVILISLGGWVRADLAWAVALLAVGILLYRGQLDTMFEPRVRTDRPRSDDGVVTEAVADEPVTAGADDDLPPPATGPMPAQPAPRYRREKSMLGRLTVGTGFVAVGLMALLDSTGVARPAFSHYLALFVGIIGIGLLVGSVVGRSRGLIFLGVVLVPVMLASSVVTARFDGGWGDPVFRPATVAEIDDHYALTGGDLEIDLRRIDLEGGQEVEIEGDVGFGRLLVLVPAGAGLDVTAHVGFGDLQIRGARQRYQDSGIDVDRTHRIEGDGLFHLDLDVGFGQLEIREVSR